VRNLVIRISTIFLIGIALLAVSYGQVKQIPNKKIIAELNKNYQYFLQYCEDNPFYGTEEYYYHSSNTDCIGLGVVNPKDFHFQVNIDTSSMPIQIENIETQTLLIPLFCKPDYLIFYMTVVEISGNWFKVQVNRTMTLWVNKSEVKFYTWDSLLYNTTGIIAGDAFRGKTFFSESIDLRDNDDYALAVEKVEGDWVYVRAVHIESESVTDYYWVRWKDERNKVLIRPLFLD